MYYIIVSLKDYKLPYILLYLVSMDHFAKDMICGSLSGLSMCVSGYILDTLKVRMQINPNIAMISTLKSIIKREGFMNLFNGIYYPLATLPILNAISFSAY